MGDLPDDIFAEIDRGSDTPARYDDGYQPAGSEDGRFQPIDSYEAPVNGHANGHAAGSRIIIPGTERDSTFFLATDFSGKEIPDRQWCVPGMIPASTVTLLGGDGGTGKSLLALQLAATMATGGTWMGRRLDPRNALYITAEDERDEVHRRLDAIGRANDVPYSEMGGLAIRSLAGRTPFSPSRTSAWVSCTHRRSTTRSSSMPTSTAQL